ncbi:hypothetical protein DFJ73DRAFT_218795 [Zopfochytrium polystomum]|nr:hypothetical protein DFJ73DRAFT_218795 [Zopfochytrium polystomum]
MGEGLPHNDGPEARADRQTDRVRETNVMPVIQVCGRRNSSEKESRAKIEKETQIREASKKNQSFVFVTQHTANNARGRQRPKKAFQLHPPALAHDGQRRNTETRVAVRVWRGLPNKTANKQKTEKRSYKRAAAENKIAQKKSPQRKGTGTGAVEGRRESDNNTSCTELNRKPNFNQKEKKEKKRKKKATKNIVVTTSLCAQPTVKEPQKKKKGKAKTQRRALEARTEAS